MKLVYLASPYSHDDEGTRTRRYKQVCRVQARLYTKYPEYTFFGPIAMSHGVSVHGDLHFDWQFWQEHDYEFIRRSDELWVIMIDGWENSQGVQEEVKYMKSQNKPVLYLYPGTLENI